MSDTRAVLIEVEELEKKPSTSKTGIFSHRHRHHKKTAPGGPPKPPHGSKTVTTYDDDEVNIKKNRCYPCF
jgi:hypothetical protein